MLACFLAVYYTGPGHPRSSGAVIVSFGRRRSHCSERRPTFLHRVSNRGPRTCKAVGIPALSSSSSPLLPRALGQRLMVRAELRVVDAPVDHAEWASVAVLSAVPPALGAPHDLNIVVIVVAHL